MVRVEILRDYPVGRRTYRVGEVIEVEAKTFGRLSKTRPPYMRRAKQERPEPKPETAKEAKA